MNRVTLLIMLATTLSACVKKSGQGDCAPERWYAANGATVTLECQKVTYYRPTPECRLVGEIEKMPGDRNNVLWHLEKTCAHDEPRDEHCWIATGLEHKNISCQGLGINTTFYLDKSTALAKQN